MKRIIALGAENKSSFSAISDEGLYISESGANLTDIENFQKFNQSVNKFIQEHKAIPDYIACDAHPDYCSTHLAQSLQQENKGAKLVLVQHHFAHIVSCMLDNDIDEEVIGVSFDGAGFGSDGKIWGGEFLICNRKDFSRPYHLRYVPQPGGDIAARQGWRMAVAYLLQAYGQDFSRPGLSLVKRIGKSKINFICQMIQKDVNCPLTSSAGRLFDAVASLIGIADVSQFEAEAAILLEQKAAKDVHDYYSYEIKKDEVDVARMIREMVQDLQQGEQTGVISAKFHQTMAEIIFNVSMKINQSTAIDKVLISGGCFQNRYLTNYLVKRFAHSSLKLYRHKQYSPTDSSISIGQAVVAASRD